MDAVVDGGRAVVAVAMGIRLGADVATGTDVDAGRGCVVRAAGGSGSPGMTGTSVAGGLELLVGAGEGWCDALKRTVRPALRTVVPVRRSYQLTCNVYAPPLRCVGAWTVTAWALQESTDTVATSWP